MIHIYTGDGKGKTTAAIGVTIRAAGSGMKCGFFSFLKDGSSAEISVLSSIERITVFDMPRRVPFLWDMTEDEKCVLKTFYEEAMRDMEKADLDLLVLDEAVTAVDAGMVKAERILELARNRELVLTGRGENEVLFAAADYITIMKKAAHPFDRGIQARRGIEY